MRPLYFWLAPVKKNSQKAGHRGERSRRNSPRLSLRSVVQYLEDRSVPASLTLTIPAASMSEAAGPNAVGALLNRTGDLSQPLTVNLTSSDTTEATVPATASFAVGQQEVGFSISAVDDAIQDGTQTVTITGTANVTQGLPFGLDTSYGTGGLAPTQLRMAVQPPVQAITLQPDGKAIVASENSANNGWHVQRFNTDGTLDTTFGSGLVNTTGLGSFAVPYQAIVQPDGKILIGGKVSGGSGAALLVRYNVNGTLDTSFGVGGIASLGSLGTTWVTDIALRPDGRILLGLGQNGSVQTKVAQLNPNGTFDSTFGASGVSNLNLGWWAQEVEVLADGTFLIGGTFRMPVHVARVNANGIGLVTSFGTSGVASLNFGTDGSSVAGMAVDAQGRIVVGVDVFNFVNGNSTPADFGAGRLNPNGTPDTTFAGDGTAVFSISGSELSTDLVVQQDGKVIVGGRISDATTSVLDSAMVRFNENGTPDTTFDGDGFFRQSLVTTFSPDQITGMALQDDGKLLTLTGWGTDWRIARFNLGQQQFTLSASDTIDVLDNETSNQPPVAQSWQFGTPEDTPLNDFLRASDPNGDPLTYTIVSQPAQGSVQITNINTGAFTFTPALNFNGTVSFTFKVNDGQVDSNIATVFVTVTPVNDAPVAQDRSFTINEDPPSPFLQGTLLATDVDSPTLTYSIVDQPTNGFITGFNAATGAFTYRPKPNFNGTDTFTYRASDGSLVSNTATVTITVNPVNDAPVPSPSVQNLTTPEDTALPGQLVANDPEGDPVTFALEAGPSNGTLTLAPNGAFTFTPNANFSGLAQFVYRASDPSGAFNLGGVNINVTPVNDAPTAGNDAYTVAEDGVLSITASPVTRLRMVSEQGDFIGQGLTYDFNPASAAFSADTNFDNGVSLDVDPPAPGEFWFLDFAAPNEVLLTPGIYLDAQRFPFQAPGRPGLDVSGNGRGSNTLTGRFTVFDVVRNATQDDVLSFAASFEQHSEGAAPALVGWVMFNSTFGAGGGVLANDTDVEGDLLLGASLVSGPSNGTLNFKGDGTFTYTPNANFHGTDSFTYRANDGRADSNIATVTITVDAANDVPVAGNDSYATPEDTPLTVAAPGVLSNDSDVDGDALSAILISGPSHGTLALNADGSFAYTPAADFNGTDSFSYKANDGQADSNVATVTLTISPVNDAPVARSDSYAVAEDTTLSVPTPGVLANDSDVEGDALTAALVSGPAHGTVTLNGNGSFVYTPAADFNGTDSFTYKANDGQADSNVATVTITVNPVNDAPVARNDSYSTAEDTQLTVAAPGVLGNDSDVEGDSLSAILVSGPSHGTLTLNAAGAFIYTPAINYNGIDTFTYRATDTTADSNVATVTIAVDPVNDAPVARGDSYSTAEDTPLTVSAPGVLSNDSDVDGDALTAILVNGPSHGTLTLNAAGAFTYSPAANFNGTDTFTYRATDGSADSDAATVTITVSPVNDVPVARNDSYSTPTGTPLTVAAPGVLANDSDVEGDALTAALVSGPAHGMVTLNSNGSFTYTPAAGFSGTDTFSYRASDGSASSPAATVTLVVSPTQPTAGKVTGAGTIDGGIRRFSVNVQSRDTAGELSFIGNISFEDRARGIRLESTAITFLRIEIDGVRATIRGTAAVNGVAGYTFTVSVADNAEPGIGADTFRIVIAGPGGFSYDSALFSPRGGLLDSGNIQVHKPGAGL